MIWVIHLYVLNHSIQIEKEIFLNDGSCLRKSNKLVTVMDSRIHYCTKFWSYCIKVKIHSSLKRWMRVRFLLGPPNQLPVSVMVSTRGFDPRSPSSSLGPVASFRIISAKKSISYHK